MSEQKRESMKQIEDDILADLLELEDQMSQYTFLVECGLELPEYPTALKTDEYLIHECQVNTWMHLEWIDDCLNWQGISDSLVICGALSLLMEIYNGRTREEIQNFHCSILEHPCFRVHFAQEQLKGLEYMVAKLYEHRLQSDCVHEQVAKRTWNVRFTLSERKTNEKSNRICICASWKYRKISKEHSRRVSGRFD